MSRVSGLRSQVLIIGGAGYIGSHMVRNLLANGITPVVFDNLSSGFRSFVPKGVAFVKGDLKNEKDIEGVLKKHKIETVMHFASSIIVPESVSDPIKYYQNNVGGFINLVKAMNKVGVKKITFSSTAAVYGEPKKVPIPEDAALAPTNPYGHTKLMCEQILRDMAVANKDFSYVILRYFNVAGAYADGSIGESHEPETHLIPIVLETALGKRKALPIYGEDYQTPDGTCIRDYIHVEDLCDAHYLALKAINSKARNQEFNLGSQTGFSVHEVVETARTVTGKVITVKIAPRRSGDAARLIASSAKAKKILGWTPKRGLKTMISSAWAWEQKQG